MKIDTPHELAGTIASVQRAQLHQGTAYHSSLSGLHGAQGDAVMT